MRGRRNDFGFAGWAAACGAGPGFTGFGRKGGAFRSRMFDRGDLKYVILRLLVEKPMHGYEIMQALGEESGGWYTPSPGSVYPALQLLQDQGYVVSEEQDGKRVYSITAEGRELLSRHSERVDDVFDRVTDFAERFSGGGMRDLTRSFVKFAQVSWEEATHRAGDTSALSELREIIERATREMRKASNRASREGKEGTDA